QVMDVPLPLDKLALNLINNEPAPGNTSNNKIYVILVATGSFNPPTFMHLRMFELARDALNSNGYCVIGGYLSPVNDSYKKKGLISAKHRIQLCHLACKSSDFVMVDQWEVQSICKDYGVVCISREGQDIQKIISENEILNENKVNIKVVDELVPNQISSTRVRDCIARGLSIKYLTADEVIDYIREQQLYLNEK
ncbi:hypothetical protein LR48_Vigan07g011500, partial [Vigna angularis]